MIVNRFIRALSPMHPYSIWTLKQGCRDSPHRDTRNRPTDSWIMCLTPSEPEEGLWIADRIGRVYKKHKGEDLAGSVLHLGEPITFNARKHLHSGHVNDDPLRAQTRVVLIAFSTLNAATVSPQVRQHLVDLGFHVPSRTLFHEAIHGPGSGEEPRLKQLTLTEALHFCQDSKDRHALLKSWTRSWTKVEGPRCARHRESRFTYHSPAVLPLLHCQCGFPVVLLAISVFTLHCVQIHPCVPPCTAATLPFPSYAGLEFVCWTACMMP